MKTCDSKQQPSQTVISDSNGERCEFCHHPKGDHSGRDDQVERLGILAAGSAWCHACDSDCIYEGK